MVWRYAFVAILLSACAIDPAGQVRSAHQELTRFEHVRGDGWAALEQRMALRRAYDQRVRALLVDQQEQERARLGADDVAPLVVEYWDRWLGLSSSTHTREADLDAGSTIELALGHLVVLRDGWLHSVALGSGESARLELIDSINLNSAPGSDAIQFRAVIVSANLLTVYGFDDANSETEHAELRSYEIAPDGRLVDGSRIQIRSEDVTWSSGRRIWISDNELLIEGKRSLEGTGRPTWPEWKAHGDDVGDWRPLAELSDVILPDFLTEASYLHSYLRCELTALRLGHMRCHAISVLADGNSQPYYSKDALYVGFGHPDEQRYTDPALAGKQLGELRESRAALARTTVLRIPVSRDEQVTSTRVKGDLVSGFDFKQIGQTLHVATNWQGETRLHSVPIEAFSARHSLLQPAIASVAATGAPRRYSEHALWLTNGHSRTDHVVWMQPLDGGAALRFAAPCCTSGLLPVDGAMIAIGDTSSLGYVVSSWLNVFAEEPAELIGELYFLYRRRLDGTLDFDIRKDQSALVSWPLTRSTGQHTDHRPPSLQFLRLDGRQTELIGEVSMVDGSPDQPTEDEDWYSNTRTVFLGERIILLSGDLLKEVRDGTEGMREVRRLALPK
jgi:hypothetical protein